MNAKISLTSVIVFLNLLITGCNAPVAETEDTDPVMEFQKEMDALAGARIDSAYKVVKQECDTAVKYQLPRLVDSLLKQKKDSAAL